MSNNRTETNRFHEELRAAGVDIDDFPDFEEVDLTEAARSANDSTLDGLCDENTVVWIGDAFALKKSLINKLFGYNWIGRLHSYDWHSDILTRFDARDRDYVDHISIFSRTLEDAGPAVEFLVRVLARDAHFGFVGLYKYGSGRVALPLSYDALEHVIEAEIPRKIHFRCFAFNVHQSILLARAPNEHVKLSFDGCSFEDEGSALADAINDNQGIQKISFRGFNKMSPENVNRFFNGLRRNTHMNELGLGAGFLATIDDAQARAVFAPLADNRGLESLSVSFHMAADKFPLLCPVLQGNNWLKRLTLWGTEDLGAEQWNLFGRSIKIHPSIEIIDIENINNSGWSAIRPALPGMLETNTVIRRIVLRDDFYRTLIYQSDIWPRLVMNRFRPLFAAIKEEQDPTRRAKLFGWALHLVKSNPRFPNQFALLQRLTSENPDLVMRYYVQKDSRAGNCSEESGNVVGTERRRA